MGLVIFKYLLYGVLPGYLVAHLALRKKRSVTAPEFLVWSALSHPLLALIVFGFLLLGGSLDRAAQAVDALLVLLFVTSLALSYRSREKGSKTYHIPWDIVLSATGILLLCIPMLSTRTWFAYHAFWHSGIVNSLLAGQFPPENPGFAGEPVVYIWLYHLWVGLMVIKTGLHPAAVNLTGHVHLLVALLGLSIVIAQAWGLQGKQRVWSFWLLVGSINIGALVHLAPYLGYWLLSDRGLVHSYLDHVSQNLHPLLSLTGTFLKIPVFYKSWSFLNKFFSFNAMAHGMFFFYLFAWSLNRLFVDKESAESWTVYVSALLGLLLFYPVFILFAVLFSLLYTGLLFFTDRPRISILVKCAFVSILCCAVCLPYFSILGIKVGAGGAPVFALSFEISHLWFYAIGPFWPLVPVLLYWIFKIRPAEKQNDKTAFLSAGLLASCLAPVFIAIGGGPANYKYVFLAALFITWAALSALLTQAGRKSWQLLRVGYTGLAAGTILITVLGWSLGSWFEDDRLYVIGREIRVQEQEGGSEALEWIATQTVKDAMLSVPLTAGDSKASTTYALAALAGRSLYVANDRTWAGGYEAYADRKALAEYIWGSADVAPRRPGLLLNGRPLYLVYSEDVERTTKFYNELMEPIKPLVFFPGSQIVERVESLGFNARQAFEKDRFKVLEIVRQERPYREGNKDHD